MTCCRRRARSTSASTTSWPTTSPPSSAVYALADQPLDDRARAAQAAYLADHQRNRYGAVRYDLAPFGVDPDALRARFAPYTDRFLTP